MFDWNTEYSVQKSSQWGKKKKKKATLLGLFLHPSGLTNKVGKYYSIVTNELTAPDQIQNFKTQKGLTVLCEPFWGLEWSPLTPGIDADCILPEQNECHLPLQHTVFNS